MIRLLTGENSYEIERELGRLVAAFNGEPEKFDGEAIELKQLPDILSGQSLFAEKRLIVIRDLSKNKPLWGALVEQLERVSDVIDLVLVESAPDKRTKTYKALQKAAEVKDFPLLTERDNVKAEQWLLGEAKRLGANLDKSAARMLLRRSLAPTERGQPVIDQWRAMHSLEKLSVLGAITPDLVEKYIEAQSVESVFGLFETALRGDAEALHQLLGDLEAREDPYKVFGLLAGQVFQLAALVTSDQPPSETAKAIGVHPFAMGKLAPLAKKCSKQDIKQIILAFSTADEAMKTSKGAPWVLIEQALIKIAVMQSSGSSNI